MLSATGKCLQIAAWLESPDRADRRRGSFHLSLVRQSMEDAARTQPKKETP